MGVSGGVSVHVLGPDVTASHFRGTHWETWLKASCGLKGGGRSAINGPKVSGIQGEEEGGGRSGACAGDLLPTLQCVHQPAEGDRVSGRVGSATKSQHVDLVTFDWTAAVSRTYHSIASSRPTPFRAEVLKICHFLSFRAGRPRAFATSVGVIAWSMSCLFAKTTRMAFFSSSS